MVEDTIKDSVKKLIDSDEVVINLLALRDKLNSFGPKLHEKELILLFKINSCLYRVNSSENF